MESLTPHILTKENFSELSQALEDYPSGIVVPIDKPYQYSSTEVVGRLKFFFKKFFGDKKLKVGHAGTLDPLATGLLLVCIGKATKIAELLQAQPKEYVAQFIFGAVTPSYDREHPISQLLDYNHITNELIESAVLQMIGEKEQIPPMFSAKMVDGKRLYSLARKGEDIELKSSKIQIYSAQILDVNLKGVKYPLPEPLISPPFSTENSPDNFTIKKRGKERGEEDKLTLTIPDALSHLPGVTIRISCSKGTYIRSIARDLGLSLNSGGFLNALCRTRIGDFTLEQTLSLNDFKI